MEKKSEKYIDANWLLNLIQLMPHNGDLIYSSEVEDTIVEMLNNEEDYVEVKHGQWIDKYGNKYSNHLYVCSVCGEEALWNVYDNGLGNGELRQVLTPGCPYCLTVMDGKEV